MVEKNHWWFHLHCPQKHKVKHKVKLKTCSPQQPHPHISACESIYLDLIVQKCIRKQQSPTVLYMNFLNASGNN